MTGCWRAVPRPRAPGNDQTVPELLALTLPAFRARIFAPPQVGFRGTKPRLAGLCSLPESVCYRRLLGRTILAAPGAGGPCQESSRPVWRVRFRLRREC